MRLTRDSIKFLKPQQAIVLVITGVFACILTVAIGQSVWQKSSLPLPPIITQPTATPTPTPDPLRPRSILLLGYVGGTHDGGSLTDTMMVAQINPKTKRITLISLPRDLWVNIPLSTNDSKVGKINTAYSIGNDTRQYSIRDERYQGKTPGLTLTKDVVSEVTGLPIDFAASISMQGFLTALDTLGPLTIDVPYTFTDEFYPILGLERESCGYSETDIATISAAFKGFELEQQFPCRYETLEFTRGPTTMDAETALKFVRSRHSGTGGGDFGRTQRQQALISAVKDKLASPSSWASIIPTLTKLYKSVSTDFTLDDMSSLTSLGLNPQEFTITSITLDRSNVLQESRSSDGQYILVVKTNPTATLSASITATPSASQSTTPSPLPNQIDATNPWQLVHDFILLNLSQSNPSQ